MITEHWLVKVSVFLFSLLTDSAVLINPYIVFTCQNCLFIILFINFSNLFTILSQIFHIFVLKIIEKCVPFLVSMLFHYC